MDVVYLVCYAVAVAAFVVAIGTRNQVHVAVGLLAFTIPFLIHAIKALN